MNVAIIVGQAYRANAYYESRASLFGQSGPRHRLTRVGSRQDYDDFAEQLARLRQIRGDRELKSLRWCTGC